MAAPLASKVERQAPAIWNSKRHGTDWRECQLWYGNKDPDNTEIRWGQDIVCPSIHVRSDPSSGWILRNWGFVTTVENAERYPIRLWVTEKYSTRQSILPWMLSWDLFQDTIKEVRGGSFPEDLVLRLPWVEDPLKASTEFEWRISMAVAEVFLASDERMWCGRQTRTMAVCRAKEFRTLVDQGWAALMHKLKEGEIGDANGEQSKESDSTTDSNVAEGHDLQAKDRNSSTEDVADATAGDNGNNAATETSTTTTTTVDNSTTTTTSTIVTTLAGGGTTTTTTIITTTVGGDTTTTTSTATTSKKRRSITQTQSRDGGNNKRPRGSTTRDERNTVTIDLEQEQ